eukprot:4526112-Karenia_brevis.AAC.1
MVVPREGFRRVGGGRALRDPPKPAAGDAATRNRLSDINEDDDEADGIDLVKWKRFQDRLKDKRGDGGDDHGNVGGPSSSSSSSGAHGNVSAAAAAGTSSSSPT